MTAAAKEKRDPRTLFLAASGAAFCVSLVRSLPAAGLCLCLAALLALARGTPPRLLLKRLAAANVFIAFLWLAIPLSAAPAAGAAALALRATLKCNAILLAFLALLSGVSPPRLGCALERLRVPPKLVFLLLFTWRHIHAVREEWARLQTAAALRGFVPRNSRHTYRTIGNMIGLAFVNALARSKRIHEAMLLRGFAGTFRTAAELRRSRGDLWFGGAFFLVLCGVLLFDGSFV